MQIACQSFLFYLFSISGFFTIFDPINVFFMKKLILIILTIILSTISLQAQKYEWKPNVRLANRTVIVPPIPILFQKTPTNNLSAEGIVLIKIKVDRQGYVQEAIPKVKGKTVISDGIVKLLIRSAERTQFNYIGNGHKFQYGTITYTVEPVVLPEKTN